MALNRTLEIGWRSLCHYKVLFMFGIFILSLQLYVAITFLHSDDASEILSQDKSEIKIINFNVIQDEHSARHTKEETIVDDEDIQINSNSVILNRPQIDTNKQLNLKTNKTVLRLEELDFVPVCDVNSKDAVSAIRRARTQYCKQHIVNVTCLIQRGQLYPVSLENYCPHKDLHAGRSLGCFQDEKAFRLLNGYYANYKTNNSPEHCIRMCLQSGFVYAGVQYSTECFCGNDRPPSTARLPDPSCNMKCPANPKKACGGYFTINIYETGIAAFIPQQAELKLHDDNKRVRIAFLLTLNGRAVRQVKRLIRALFHFDHYFYIHVDARQDYLYRELLALENKFPNIRLARKRYATIWGGASLLEMLLNSMKFLLESNWKWDFVINLSESDFPVKTIDKLVEFLTANQHKNFVKSHGREIQRFIQKQGLDKTFIECDSHMWRVGDRQLPWGIQIDGGSDWVALSRPFIEYISKSEPDNLIKGLSVIYKYTLLPAESFFHTVLRNSEYCNTYIDNNLHITNWKRKLGCKCQYKHIVDWCGCSPNDFKIDDWPRILATESKQLYFARKFEPVINQAIILQLEEWLYGPHYLNVTNINSYWQSIYHHADLSPPVDDAVHTISVSMARLLMKYLNAHKCSTNQSDLIEITSFFANDKHEGVVVACDVNLANFGSVRIETLMKYQTSALVNKNHNNNLSISRLIKRLKSFYVSSDYDQKEQVSRNFGRFLGPFSEPVLIYEFLPSIATNPKPYNISFIWLDPSGNIADVNHAVIDTQYVINFVKLTRKSPLLPGVWTIKLIHAKTVFAQTVFLITPLEFIAKMPISSVQALLTHSDSVRKTNFSQWQQFVGKTDAEREFLSSLVVSNSKRIGPDLQEWIDALVKKFYKIVKICVHNNQMFESHFKCNDKLIFKFCSRTNWSTYAPDPKSELDSFESLKLLTYKTKNSDYSLR